MSVASKTDTSPIDVAAFIDSQPVGGFQIQLILICAAVLFLDGFDTTAIGYVAPALAKEWELGKAAISVEFGGNLFAWIIGVLSFGKGVLGVVFSGGLFGLMIGALLFGPLADRFGRKRIIIFSTLTFGLGTLITAFVNDVNTLLIVRFLTGLGLGGAMPNTISLTAEFSPRRRRATMVMVMFVGFSIGAALGGLLAAALIPHLGWRSVFIVGGALPLILVPILALRLPESVRYLALTGQAHEGVAQLLSLVNREIVFSPASKFVVNEPALSGIPVQHLFRDGRTIATILLWVVFFMSLLDIYFLSNWLPTVMNDLGASFSVAAVIGSMFQVGGVVGTFVLGNIIDRFSFRALALVYFVAVFAVGAIGQLGHSAALVTVAIFVAGFCIVGGQIAANALAAGFYPTAVRSTGVGWALGIGRVGSIVGPLVGGILLGLKWSAGEVFAAAALAALCAAAAAFSLSRLAGPTLEDRGKAAPDRPSCDAVRRADA